ncbi:hypothetical protein [Elizabethkingia ursingii]|jgi:hypothetical protein|uniref:Uncharacterized protein n=1 Tax=Elizabethkingia ursingii TaxID=1756150 RepID=A0AAJ3NAF3_9FLAO|nr:hypothetical protein [Elizabethkingia ursingii]AQX08205.1 hypothetical protein BBD34_05900 [Elizabethkingia ursingii]MDR2229248.1 hypothetical protein [Flavobacteriaceae bacterium]OPB73439.1 hypothetical protein BAY32_10320 [Elizabethkingia ursingii]OPB86957.1 hypothetical protein BB021_10610 [Elizabethkingia ursingii]
MNGFYFDPWLVISSTIIIFLIVGSVSIFVTKKVFLSLIIAIIKAGIYFYYFSFADKRFTFVDDDTYILTTKNLYEDGFNIYNIFYYLIFDKKAITHYVGSEHFMYQVYNLLSFELFGPYYFSPVALNIILTSFIAYKLYQIVILLNGNNYKILAVFGYFMFVIHWDTVSWSSYLNLKDFFVEFLTINIIVIILKIFQLKKINFWLSVNLALSTFTLFYLRYYIPGFILIASLFYIVFFRISYKKYFGLLLIIFPIIIAGIIIIILPKISTGLSVFQAGMSNPILGIPRYLLTPVPFQVDQGGEFQTFAAYLHWIFFPVFLFGVYKSWKLNEDQPKLLIIYFLILCLFYGSFNELQGPRHRIQVHFIFIYFQLVGIFILKNIIKNKKAII